MQENLQGVPVIREDGVTGRVMAITTNQESADIVVIHFDDGAEVAVAPEMLSRQPDDSYVLLLAASQLSQADELVIPVVTEEIAVGKDQVTRSTVRVHTHVETREQVVDTPVEAEEIVVERIPINTIVEGDAPQIREEDGVLVIPVLEEVLVVEKRLMLREEVRLTKYVTHSAASETVTLRREVVDIERVNADEQSLADEVRQGA